MNKVIAVLCLIAPFAMSSCRECDKAKSQIIDPVNLARIYMDAEPKGSALQETGCQYLVYQLQYLPEASQMLRDYAMKEYSPGTSHCQKWVEATRYSCTGATSASGNCQWTPYSRCTEWVRDVPATDYRYDSTMKLADYLDGLDLVVQNMCKLAMDGKYHSAEVQAEGVRRFIREKVIAHGMQFYSNSCQ